jgi:hypothetical protein
MHQSETIFEMPPPGRPASDVAHDAILMARGISPEFHTGRSNLAVAPGSFIRTEDSRQ